tara:strand:- start:31548 stop:32126 length:579 start_codon:yes stop_codon:yes gene_type:complete
LKKIGLLGGTFDPVHNGHIRIARSFIESGCIDELWVLLTPFPPHKLEKDHVSYSTRLIMLKKAFSNVDCIILSIENDLPKPSYTYRTIQFLKKKHTDHQFYFCMGEDSLSQFHKWKHFDKILEEANLLVARRPNSSHANVNHSILKQTVFVDHEPIEISSSEIKERIKESDFIKKNLPHSVFSIIEKENLYR